MAEPIIANPIGWLQVRLLGGWRKVFQITGVAAAAVFCFHILIYRMIRADTPLDSFCMSAFRVMAVVQGLILLVGGPGAIRKALLRDYTTDMISSHRQTGLSGGSAVLGYMTGATMQVIILALLCWLTCTVLAVFAGPLVSNLASTVILVWLLISATMYWALSVLLGLGTQGKTNAAGLVIVIAMVSFSGALAALPGLNLLVGAPIREVTRASSSTVVVPAAAVSLMAQLMFAVIFFLAAARKYTRDDVPAFNPVLAFILLALCALLGAVGLEGFAASSGGAFGSGVFSPEVQLIATLVALLLAAFLPVGVAARLSASYGRRRSREPAATLPKPRPFIESAPAATLLVFVILAAVLLRGSGPLSVPAMTASESLTTLGLAALPFLFSLLCVAGLLRFAYVYTSKASWLIFFYIVLFWVIPPLADLGFEVVLGDAAQPTHTWLLACSPVGSWIVMINQVEAPLLPGLIFQGILAAAGLFLASRARH